MLTSLGNPWNPMPGWRWPGLRDDPAVRFHTAYNQGVFDAIGVPYAFELDFGNGVKPLVFRELQAIGIDALAAAISYERAVQQFGEERGRTMITRWLRDQFVHARNLTISVPFPFWAASPQTHPRWAGREWVLTCNANRPPGLVPPDEYPLDPDEAFMLGNDLLRWSAYPRSAPSPDGLGGWKPYVLWQSEDAEINDSDLPTFVPRSAVRPFPDMLLRGRAELNHGEPLIVRAVNV